MVIVDIRDKCRVTASAAEDKQKFTTLPATDLFDGLKCWMSWWATTICWERACWRSSTSGWRALCGECKQPYADAAMPTEDQRPGNKILHRPPKAVRQAR